MRMDLDEIRRMLPLFCCLFSFLNDWDTTEILDGNLHKLRDLLIMSAQHKHSLVSRIEEMIPFTITAIYCTLHQYRGSKKCSHKLCVIIYC